MTTRTEGPLWEVGALYRIDGELGTFKLMSLTPHKDGSMSLYGGTTGNGQYRCIQPQRLTPESRKHIIAVRKRMEANK